MGGARARDAGGGARVGELGGRLGGRIRAQVMPAGAVVGVEGDPLGLRHGLGAHGAAAVAARHDEGVGVAQGRLQAEQRLLLFAFFAFASKKRQSVKRQLIELKRQSQVVYLFLFPFFARLFEIERERKKPWQTFLGHGKFKKLGTEKAIK